jgi:hypothetical protein
VASADAFAGILVMQIGKVHANAAGAVASFLADGAIAEYVPHCVSGSL